MWHGSLRCAQAAERGRIDVVFFADGIGVRAGADPPDSNRNVPRLPS